jgi:hypothetical protein
MAKLGCADVPDWIRSLAATRHFGAGDRRGTANLIDAAARARAAACIRAGKSVSLARNCDFAALRRSHGPGTQVAGALVVSPLAIEGANGANLNRS